MRTISRLTGAAYGIHLSDQVALVSVPLIASLVFNASPQVIGILVACQSMAHLLGSIPFGILVDSIQQRNLTIAASLVSLTGFSGAVLAIMYGSIVLFGASVTLAGFGVVLFGLAALSILPKISERARLAKANAAIEVPRAITSFAVPLLIGLYFTAVAPVLIVAIGVLASLLAVCFTATLPTVEMHRHAGSPVFRRIAQGGDFVLRHRLLRPISLCAVFWNLAFAALLVVLVPVIREVYMIDAGAFGMGLSAFGLASLVGALVMKRFSDRISPNLTLLFGPGSSACAALGMVLIPTGSSPAVFYACAFLLGFGPSMWLVTQNSVRQLVTPSGRLGSVNAVIQTAIYGVRPIGALAGGIVAGSFDPQTGMVFVAVAFGASFLAAVCSDLRGLRSYAELTNRDEPAYTDGRLAAQV